MRKVFKVVLIAGGILAGLFVILLAAAAIIIPAKYPPAKLKSIAEEKLSETLKRKVTVGDVHFNVLSGFEITKLSISNRPGWAQAPFVSADNISVSYHLFPLFWGQVSLGEIKLNQLQILVEKRSGGQFNFSDMMTDASTPEAAPGPATQPKTHPKTKGKSKKKTKKRAALSFPAETPSSPSFFVEQAWADTAVSASEKPSKAALLVSVDSVNIANGKLIYLDETASPAQRSDLQDLSLTVKNISMVGGKTSFELDAPLSYNQTAYHLVVGGSFRYFLAGQTLKELQVKGMLNDLAFGVSGEVQDMTGNYTPNLDGSASLDMLKFSGLIPSSLSKMPEGLSLTGPAKVDFHLGGNAQKGLELSGTADGSQLALAYKDLFVKTASTACKVEFKTINQLDRGIYDVPSIKVTYDNWEVTGAFHYHDGSFSGEVHSKSLPFQGLPAMIPKLKKATFSGTGSVDVAVSKGVAKTASLNTSGQILLKGVGITLPQEPYLQDMTGAINFKGNVVRVPGITFSSFDGTGVAGVTYTLDTQAYRYGFNLKNVDAQKAIDSSIDAYVTTKDYSSYKDKLFGKLNLVYAGSGRGLSGDTMISTAAGSGSYVLADTNVKGIAILGPILKFFKDSSGQINFDRISGNLLMKNKVFSYSADCTGKVGNTRVAGGIDCEKMVYTPDMTIQNDLGMDFLSSDQVDASLPDFLRGQAKNLDWLADDQGLIPIDIKYTGKVSDNHFSYDFGRASKNLTKHLGQQLQNSAQPIIQNLGSQLKKLF